MKRKIFYTLSFIFCISMYASSKESMRKEESGKQAKVLSIKEQPVKSIEGEEIAAEFPLAHILCHLS